VRETAVALAVLVALSFLAWLLTLPPAAVMLTGQTVMLGGGAVGIPLELVYYALLGAALGRRSALPRGWYWRPFEHHHLLSPREAWLVLPFFWTGLVAFVVCVLGIVVTTVGLVATVASFQT